MGAAAFLLLAVLALPFIFALLLIGAAGFQAIEPIYQTLQGGQHLGNMGSVLLMTSVGLISLPLVVLLWWWLTGLRTDVRQGLR